MRAPYGHRARSGTRVTLKIALWQLGHFLLFVNGFVPLHS
jgi:hypothetical protein